MRGAESLHQGSDRSARGVGKKGCRQDKRIYPACICMWIYSGKSNYVEGLRKFFVAKPCILERISGRMYL